MILETNFSYQNEVLWRNALKLIRKIITQVDYKGVRDILGHLLSQFPKLPNTGYALDNIRRSHLEELILFIISPEENLLPAYFVLDEVQKKKSIWKNASHSFRRKMEVFIDRFHDVAAINSPSNRSPILIISTLIPNNWLKLEISGKYPLKGAVPYDSSISAPQKDLILFLLEQNRSFDNVISILSLGTGKDRNHFFEDALVELVVRAIEKFSRRDSDMPLQEPSPLWDTRLEELREKEAVKKQESRQILIEFFEFLKGSFHTRQTELIKFNYYDFVGLDAQLQQSRKFWQHITNMFLSFGSDLFQHNIYFPDVIDGICSKVEKLIHRNDRPNYLDESRDCFMFFLLNIVSNQRSSISTMNILKLLKLIETFYSRSESKENSSKNGENGDVQDISMEEDNIEIVYNYSGAALFVHLSNYCNMDPVLNDIVSKVPKEKKNKVNTIWSCKESGNTLGHYFNLVLCHACKFTFFSLYFPLVLTLFSF